MPVVQLHNFSEKFKKDLIKLNHWPAIQSIFQALDQKKRLCWISGGAVRDLLLSRRPADIDLTTDALEEEILELFPQAVLVGREFGVYKIPLNGEIYDLTVFREEGEYIDGRRPTEIRRSTPTKDAERRDFTVNALFWDIKNAVLIDSVGGLADLEKKQIRCVGLPLVRFQEDFLRVLRMVRLAYQLNFKIDPESYRAGLTQAASLTQISGERILAEILKIKEPEVRWKFFSDELMQLILKHNDFKFEDLSGKIETLKRATGIFKTLELRIMTEFLYLLGLNSFQVEKLQKRFKLSKEVKLWLIKCCEIQNYALSKTDYVEYCLLIDRSEDFQLIINYFSTLNLISQDLAQHIISVYQQHFKALISAQDIIPLVPAHNISKTLNYIRKLQFKGQIATSLEALAMVKSLDVSQE